jgi:hypothetical protein
MNTIYIGLFILSFFFPWISLIILILGISYLTWVYSGSTKKTKKTIAKYKREIIQYFENKIGSSEFHYKYISENSLYFLYPASSKVFGKILISGTILLVLINIVFFFKFEYDYYLFPILSFVFALISLIISQKFERPILDYQNRNKSHISSTPLFEGVEEYPNFFYHGEWRKIINS